MATLTWRNLEIRRRGRLLFPPLSGELISGDRLRILGDSGSGKTSLMLGLAGLIPVKGEIVCGGKPGMVFQENFLLEEFTGRENLLSVAPLSREEMEKGAKALDLVEALDEKVRRYSGGMKRRLALLRALAVNPDILFLDEAFREVEGEMAKKMGELVEEKMKEGIVVYCTHDLSSYSPLKATGTLYPGKGENHEVI